MIPAGPSICDVLPAAAALLGAADGAAGSAADGAANGAGDGADRLGLLDRLGPRRRVVVLLVDGLGRQLLPRLAPHAPFLAAALDGEVGSLQTLHSTFPSTTPTSLVSLGTGARPGEHGVLGFTVNLPGTERTLTHVLWRDDPPPRAWQPVPTWFERLASSGVPSAVVLPAAFAGGGLTTAAYRGASFVPASPDPAGTVGDPGTVIDVLASGVPLVFAYTDVLDAAAHRFGIASERWLDAGRRFDELLAVLHATLPPDTALLVTADHGGLDVPADRRVDLDADPDLSDGVRVVAGEPRVRYLHTRAGAADDVAAAWRAMLGARAGVLTRAEAIGAGWFGPVRPEHEARIGDVVVICRDGTAVFASRHEPKEVGELVGFHGAADPVETEVPLLTVGI